MRERFSMEELRDLCFNLNLDYERLEGHTNKDAFVRELITYCSRRDILDALIAL